MDPPPSPLQDPSDPSPLTSYRWHRGARGAGGFRWGRLQGWGRALSHQEPGSTREPAARSLFRRVLSAPPKEAGDSLASAPKETRTSRLRLSKSFWGRQRSQATEPEPPSQAGAPEPVPEAQPPIPGLPEAPSPDEPVWSIGAFTLLDGRLVLLGGEDEGPRRSRAGSASSQGSSQATLGGIRDPDRVPSKAEPEAAGLNQVHNVRGLLKRLKEKKKGRTDGSRDGPPSALGSRESLAALSELDLAAEQDVRVRALHPSLLEEPHCFQVTWAGGSRCFSCRSAAERDRWIEDLRRHFQPSQDSTQREETWLSVWVHEAKGLRAGGPGVRAELWLDGALLARTAARGGAGPLFWAERFHFEALPAAHRLSLRLRACPGGAKLGRVALGLGELGANGLERWFPLLGAPPGAALRARVRARRLRVLPSERYKELAEFLTFHYARLCEALEPALSAQAKEELANAMVRVLQATGRAQALVTDLGTAELARCGGREALLFRENTLATKAIDEYMKLVAREYLQETLGPVVRRLCASTEDCEVDPSKCPATELALHQARLRTSCKEVFESIVHSSDWFPSELGAVFGSWRSACQARGSEALGPRLVCASLFLRLLCPALLAPCLFGLTPQHPEPRPARALTLIAKVIQNLANRAPFGEKEAYMTFLDSFLEEHGPAMQRFLEQVAEVDADASPRGYQAGGDLALHLASLHAQLCMSFTELNQATRDSLEPLPTILRAIEQDKPVPVSVPLRLPEPPSQSHASVSAGEKRLFLAPRDLPKHTPLISKSLSLRSERGSGGWAPRSPQAPRPPTPPRRVQRAQSVPARRPARRPASSLPRPRPPGSTSSGPAPRRAWPGASASLPRKPSVPWQRQLDQPRDKEQASGAPRPLGKLTELRCDLAGVREELKALTGLLETLMAQVRMLTGQQEELRTHLKDLSNGLRRGRSRPDTGGDPPSSEALRLESLELRLAKMETAQLQLTETVQSLQLLPGTLGAARSPPLPPKTTCVNGGAP